MNKRMISFFLTLMLVVATICQPVAAAPRVEDEQAVKAEKAAKAEKAEKTANREKITEDEALEAVTVSENGYERVSLSQENPYVVYKFVPQETEEYYFFSSRIEEECQGDPYVYVYQGEELAYIYSEDDYENSEEDLGVDFGGKLELQKDVPYYFVATTYNYAEEGYAAGADYYFVITSDYSNRSEWIANYYANKTVSAVSMNDLPRYEFLDIESDAISAEIPVDGIEVVTYFEDGTDYTEYIYNASDYEYDEQERVVATYFDTITNTYKVYWEKLKEVDGGLYLDNTVSNNNLCIEDEEGRIEKYPVVIKEADISDLELKTAPTVVSDKILISRNYPLSYDCGLPFHMEGLELTVTRKDGTKYDVTYQYYYDEDYEENFYYFTCSEGEEILPYSFALEREENNQFCLGDNTLTVTYGGMSVEIPVFLYEVTKRTVLNPIAIKKEIYPFENFDSVLSIKGLKLQTNYSDGTSRIVEVTEDVRYTYLDGYYAEGFVEDDKVYLHIYFDYSTMEIGTIEKVIKPMSTYPGIKSFNQDTPFDVTIGEKVDRVVYRYTPDVTAEYRIYSEPGDKPEGDPRVDVYTNTDTESVASGDDDNDMQFDFTMELKAGTTYYFAFKSYEKPETFRVTFESTKQLPQVITAPASITKKMNDAPFAIGAKAYGNTPMTYVSSNPAVATIDAKGMVTIKSAGTTTITISAAQTKSFTAATKKVTLTVNKIPVTINAADTITKAKGAKKFLLNASSAGKMTYASSNTKVATVDANGKVTVKNCGKAVITIKATADGYLDAEKQVVIKVVPKKAKIKSVKSSKAGQITVKWTRQKEAKGYIIEYSTDKNFKKNVKSVKVKKNKTTSKTIKKLKKGKKYYVRVKAYVTIDKKAETGAASAKKNVKIKK